MLKVEHNIKRLKKEILRVKAEKNLSTTSVEKKAYLEGVLLHKERKLTKSIFSKLVLEKNIVAQMEKEQTAFLNVQREMRAVKENLERTQVSNRKHSGNDFFRPYKAGEGERREKIVTTGTTLKKVIRWHYPK